MRGSEVPLTPKEFDLLSCLIERAGKVLSAEELLSRVWGHSAYSEQNLKRHISSLRRKIEEDAHDPRLVVTVWGSGYKYDWGSRNRVAEASAI